jgi:hypothetical protein
VLVLFGEYVVGEAAVSGGECFFLALAAFDGRHCGDVDAASAQLNLQARKNSWVAECDVLWMAPPSRTTSTSASQSHSASDSPLL